jgi:PPOX class probable F420-dependent enzyme
MLDLSRPRHQHIAERLRSNVIAWLGTVRPDGRPHLVAVWFLWDGERILIFSKPNNQKVRNLRQNPNVTVALDDTDDGDDPIVIEGAAELVDDPDISTNLPAYLEKYGEAMKEIGLPGAEMAKVYSQAIRITPVRVV